MCFLSALAKRSQQNYNGFHSAPETPEPEAELGLPRLIKNIAKRGAKLDYSGLVRSSDNFKEKGPAIHAFEVAGLFSEWSLPLGYATEC